MSTVLNVLFFSSSKFFVFAYINRIEFKLWLCGDSLNMES
jgi:hypothetical protein